MTPALAAGSATCFGSCAVCSALTQAFAMLLLWRALLMVGVGWLDWVRLDWPMTPALRLALPLALVFELDALLSVML
jgi:hypothetical protein